MRYTDRASKRVPQTIAIIGLQREIPSKCIALIYTFLHFVHIVCRYYRLNGLVRSSDCNTGVIL